MEQSHKEAKRNNLEVWCQRKNSFLRYIGNLETFSFKKEGNKSKMPFVDKDKNTDRSLEIRKSTAQGNEPPAEGEVDTTVFRK